MKYITALIFVFGLVDVTGQRTENRTKIDSRKLDVTDFFQARCDLCPSRNDLAFPERVVHIPWHIPNTTCKKLEEHAKNWYYWAFECKPIQDFVAELCCTDTKSPTRQPVAPTTSVPTSTPHTSAPTSSPTKSPTTAVPITFAPVSTPIMNGTNVSATTNIVLRMDSVPSTLDTPELKLTFESIMESFLQNTTTKLFTNNDDQKLFNMFVNVTILKQRYFQRQQNRRLYQRQQYLRLMQNQQNLTTSTNELSIKVDGILTTMENNLTLTNWQ
jgi:hypothetical protein